MILFPAIDLKDGRTVRLRQGDMARATVYNDDPSTQARAFAAQGFEWLHLVDLNGAFAGAPVNSATVEAILGAVNIPVQLGGGIRTLGDIERWLEGGVRRVILGTAAVREPELVRAAARAWPGQVAVGIDARDGRVAVEGWAQSAEIEAVTLAKRFEDAGVAAIIFTDIARDGLMTGVNVEATAAMARSVSVPVIASGGLSGIGDLRALMACGAPIAGAICGRALYDGRLDPAEALDLVRTGDL